MTQMRITSEATVRVIQAAIIDDIVVSSDFEDPYFTVPPDAMEELRAAHFSIYFQHPLLSPEEFHQLLHKVHPTEDHDEDEGYYEITSLLCGKAQKYNLPIKLSERVLRYLCDVTELYHDDAPQALHDPDIVQAAALFQMCESALAGSTSSDESYIQAFSLLD